MDILKNLGLRKGWLYEVIVTSAGNAAPMGILTRDSESMEMELYKDSRTYRNILDAGEFVINFVGDVGIFYNSIFEKENIEFEDDHLKGADAFIKMEVTEKEDLSDRIGIKAIPIEFKIIKTPKPINRAESLTLESLIAKTKIPHVSAKEKEFLEKKIQENLRVVKKAAPGSRFERILEGL